MVCVTSQDPRAAGNTMKLSPAACPTHSAVRMLGSPQVWPNRPGSETAGKRASMWPSQGLLTPLSLSWPARPPSGGRAAVAAESSSSSSSRQRGGGILRADWRSSPALRLLVFLGSPETGVLWTWVSLETGGIFSSTCSWLFVYIPV